MKIFKNLGVGGRISALTAFSVIATIVLTSIAVYGLNKTSASLKTVYEDRLVALDQLAKMDAALGTIQAQSWNIAGETQEITIDHKKVTVLNKEIIAVALPEIKAAQASIDKEWKAYMATYLTPEEKVLAAKFALTKDAFLQKSLAPELLAIQKLDAVTTMHYADAMADYYKESNAALDALQKLQLDVGSAEYAAAAKRYTTISYVTYITIATVLALLALFGARLVGSILKPLKQAIQVFGQISQGNFNNTIEITHQDELGEVLQSLDQLQQKLGDDIKAKEALALQVKEQSNLYEAQLKAISNSTGVIELSLDGRVLTANQNFLDVLGYSLEEAAGRHHSAFVTSEYANSAEYKEFWAKLNRGEAVVGQFKRQGKGGREIWLEASYNPICDLNGKPYKVVKYATDITAQKIQSLDFEGQMNAISKSQGVVEVDVNGIILKANEVYLNMLGYQAHELIGQHMRLVLDPTFLKSTAFEDLWRKIVSGGSDSGQYKRIAKGGREVWIQASYNPIFDLNGKPYKIVNYTIDITEQKQKAADAAGQLTAISNVMGVIEFDLKGNILAVNDNFAAVTGYSKDEIVGKHHSMFADAAYKASAEYKAFWDKLGSGQADAGQYRRLGKGGREIWLQASYNPIFDMNGKPYKVVKYATDITEQYQTAKTLESAVQDTQAVIEGAKAGDLTSRVPLEGKTGAIASLCDGVNALMDKLTEVVVQVREAGDTINTAAGEISSGNTDLSQRTEQQATSLQETSSSMGGLASTVKQNAENAKQANQLAAAASGVAIKGGQVVGQVVTTMANINESARKIEDIISVIDGIAFQTNILALNAAVEAARAGEQGRGFAVVAGEVRNLAQRSASAAKEIKELITDSVSKTAEGTAQVENAGRTMEEIVSSVQRVTDIMGEISAASSEQSTGIDQVNRAISSMDEVTQQNAALVEEAAAAAESLVDQAEGLLDVVSSFKLGGVNQTSASQSSVNQATKVVNRRAAGSPMRGAAPKAVSKPAAKPAPVKASSKTGTDDGEWEEF